MEEIIRKLLNAKLFLFIAVSFSIIGLVQVLASVFLLSSFPIDLIEIDLLDKIPITPFFIPLLFWNLPLMLVIIFNIFFKLK